MHSPEALILRRCYPVPVTFADLREAFRHTYWETPSARKSMEIRKLWTAEIKEATGAIDEVYAVVDGREVRMTVVQAGETSTQVCENWRDPFLEAAIDDLLNAADRDGYWARPHEVRIDLQDRPVSHGEVARAVFVGQEYAERHGGAR